MTAIGSDEQSTIFRSNESEAKLNGVIKFVRDGPERCYKSEFLLEIMSYIVPFKLRSDFILSHILHSIVFMFGVHLNIQTSFYTNVKTCNFVGSQRVTSVVIFVFMPLHFGKVVGTYEILSVCECSLSTQYTNRCWGYSNLNCYNQICLNFLHSETGGR